jgi:hypothetical protein
MLWAYLQKKAQFILFTPMTGVGKWFLQATIEYHPEVSSGQIII